MNEQDIERAVLDYLSGQTYVSSEASDRETFYSLTTIFEKIMRPSLPQTDAYDPEDEIDTKEELRTLLDDMVQDGLLEAHWGERDYESSYRISDEGAYQASGFDRHVTENAGDEPPEVSASDAPGPPANAILTEAGEPLVTETGDFIVAESPNRPVSELPSATPVSVSSEAWTGIERRLSRSPQTIEQIRGQVVQLNQEIEKLGLTNTERAKAKAITEALVKLVESPEPEWKAIVALLSSPTLAGIVGIAGLVLGIIQIVMSA